MSVAMMLAIRPRWPEHGLGGLDKMYRLHKWLGIAALVTAIAHWLWAKGPKWAVGWGWLERPSRGPQPPASNPVEALFASLRHKTGRRSGTARVCPYGYVPGGAVSIKKKKK